MIVSSRSRTSAATSRPRRLPPRGSGPLAVIAFLGLAGGGCGSSSSTPADGGVGGAGGTAPGTGGRAVTGTGGAGVSPDAGTGARDGAVSTVANLAMPCTTDLDCTGGLVCLKAGGNDFFDLGGPPHGYCAIPCSGASDQKCTNIGGVCTDVSNAGDGTAFLCVEACTLGPAAAPTDKCQGRSDLACTGLAATGTAGACMPACSSASECPANTSCDFGICIRTALSGPSDPVGTHCVPPASATATDTCMGSTACISLTATSGTKNVCTRGCVLGSPTACDPALASSAAGKTHGACVGTFNQTDDVGDFGFCVEECDTAADCLDQVDSSLVCDTTNTAALGHGLCNWN